MIVIAFKSLIFQMYMKIWFGGWKLKN